MLLAVAFLFWAAIAYAFRKKNNKKIWLLLTVEFFLLLSTIPLPDFNHVITILSPSLALTAAIIEERRLKNTIGAKIINYCLTTVGTLLLLLVLWVFLTPNLHEPSFWQNPEWFKAEEWFKIIQQCPGDYIYAGPFLPNIYFEARKLNATPYPFLITRQNPPAQFEDAVRHLQARQPNCAILVYYGGLNRFHYCQDNPVENYIRQNYRLLYSDSNIFVYRR